MCKNMILLDVRPSRKLLKSLYSSVHSLGKIKPLHFAKKIAVKVAPDRPIDSSLLFQRFMIVSQTTDLSLDEVKYYELSPFHSCPI